MLVAAAATAPATLPHHHGGRCLLYGLTAHPARIESIAEWLLLPQKASYYMALHNEHKPAKIRVSQRRWLHMRGKDQLLAVPPGGTSAVACCMVQLPGSGVCC